MSDPILDPSTPSAELHHDQDSIKTLTIEQQHALARHPNTPLDTLEHLARHDTRTHPHIARNPALPLHLITGSMPDIIHVALGLHPPTHDPNALQQHLTLYARNDMYRLALQLHLINHEDELDHDTRAALQAALTQHATPAGSHHATRVAS